VLLVVAATREELAGAAAGEVCGVGPVEAAAPGGPVGAHPFRMRSP
jgi:hypothetical protein